MAATANWRCADCDTYNGPAEASCTICGSTRRGTAPRAASAAPKSTSGSAPKSPSKSPSKSGSESGSKPAAKSAPKPAAGSGTGGGRPAAKRPAVSRPSSDWRCSKCDTNNARTDLSCIVCGTGWKAATKKSTPRTPPRTSSSGAPGAKKTSARKTTPRKPTPKRTPPTTSASRDRTTPGPAAPPRTGTSSVYPPGPAGARSTASSGSPYGRRAEEGVFFPSSAATGYRPTAPRPTPVTPPRSAPPYAPRPTPPPAYRPAKKSTSGCSGCVGALMLVGLLMFLVKGCAGLLDSGGYSDSDDPDAGESAATCPARIAAELPDGDGAELVEAFRTKNKQITLCRTAAGSLYYFGEFSDGREKGIAMEAEETGDGYTARNDPYRYVIHDGVVTIYRSGSRIGEEKLTPEPSPS
ncbi:hypothetical protein ACFS5L_35570 [Streptomyces phyllanthi]|uniref:RanBP2-type domain-containing protein n=1 Tax=Streptomyces phyllanthi TaxID=1803180 RepID=A0A5N8W3Y5_9ACTN|nr:hypothetical protein [Streptomyces phyllanthi]MPY42210.1 hypothetical protein [Streptomyces phyllanthi]